MKKIIIVGVGALGSHAALFLRNVADLKIIDFDRVEQKNVLSQFHQKAAVGTNKVQSMRQTMNFLFGIKLEAVPHKLVQDNVTQLLSGADLILDCLDNGVARRLVQGFARGGSIPCLHGALAANGAFGRVIWDEHFSIDDEASAGGATCEDGAHLPFIGIVASHLARSAQKFLDSGCKVGYQIHPGGTTPI